MAKKVSKSPTNLAGRGLMKKGGATKKYAEGGQSKPAPKTWTDEYGRVFKGVKPKPTTFKKGGSTKKK